MKRLRVLGVILLFLSSVMTALPVSRAQQANPSLEVTCYVSPGRSTLYGYINAKVTLQVAGTIVPTNQSNSLDIYIPFTFSSYAVTESNLTVSIIPPNSATTSQTELLVLIPPMTSRFNITIYGESGGNSGVLFISSVTIPLSSIFLSTNPFIPTSFNVLVSSPSTERILGVRPSGTPNEIVSVAGRPYLLMPLNSSLVAPVGVSAFQVVYEPTSWFYAEFAFLGILVLLFAVLIRGSKALKTGLLPPGVKSAVAKLVKRAPGAVRSWSKAIFARSTSRRLLALFLACAVLMVAFAFVFGPGPTPKVYLASTPAVTKLLKPSVSAAGFTYLDVSSGRDGVAYLTSVGDYAAVVIADDPPSVTAPELGAAPRIIAINSSGFLTPAYLSQLQYTYPSKVTIINSTSALTAALASVPVRTNPLGLHIGHLLYGIAERAEAVLSLVLPFLALAFLAGVVVEESARGLGGAATVVVYSVFVFMFSLVVFTVTATYLGLPVALHSAISHEETAVGTLGFGGGTTPRVILGTLGMVFGTYYVRKGRLKAKLMVLPFYVILGVFLALDTLPIGSSVGTLFIGTGSLPGVSPTYSQVYQFIRIDVLQSVMNLFGYLNTLGGGWFYGEHGAVFFFAGIVPLAFFSRFRRGTATVVLALSSLACGDGFVRVTTAPSTAVASILPGIAVGFAVLPIFVLMNFAEAALSNRWTGMRLDTLVPGRKPVDSEEFRSTFGSSSEVTNEMRQPASGISPVETQDL